MNEAQFQRRVTDMAVRFGWKFWHTPAPMVRRGDQFVGAKQAAGIADLILTHDDPPRLVFMELKGDGGKLSDRQTEFLQAAKAVADISTIWQTEDDGLVHLSRLDRTVGVYAFWPKDEPLIEQLLRSRVLT